jgi:hypothetical protein
MAGVSNRATFARMEKPRRPRVPRRQRRSPPLTEGHRSAFEEQFEALKRKFGREPGPDS